MYETHHIKLKGLYSSTYYSFIQGIDFMEKLGNTINTIMNLHVHIKQPMTKQNIIHVCKLVELMKLVKSTIRGYATEVFDTTLCLSQLQLYHALQLISSAKVFEQYNC